MVIFCAKSVAILSLGKLLGLWKPGLIRILVPLIGLATGESRPGRKFLHHKNPGTAGDVFLDTSSWKN